MKVVWENQSKILAALLGKLYDLDISEEGVILTFVDGSSVTATKMDYAIGYAGSKVHDFDYSIEDGITSESRPVSLKQAMAFGRKQANSFSVKVA